MNIVVEVGRLTRDPELRATSEGKSICSFTIAVDRHRKKDGSKETDFFRCKAFGKQGETIAFFKGKGDMISVKGRLQNNNYTDRDGIKHYGDEIIVDEADFLTKEKHAQSDEKQPSNASNAFDAIDDDIPW